MEDFSYGVIPIHRNGSELKVLLVQHTSGHWSFSKGHKEVGETSIEAAQRELMEEAGVTECELLPYPVFQENYSYEDGDQSVNKIVELFLGRVNNPKIEIMPEEIRDFRWVGLADAIDLATFPETKKVLEKVSTYLKKTSLTF